MEIPTSQHVTYTLDFDSVYSLPRTMLSSYACYFVSPRVRNTQIDFHTWDGDVAPFYGCEFIQPSRRQLQIVENGASNPFCTYEDFVGHWYQRPSAGDKVFARLISEYPGIRLPRLSFNPLDVLVAIICSGHTTITMGRLWFQFLKRNYPLRDLGKADPLEIMARSKEATGVSMGYRARYVADAISSIGEDPETTLRQTLRQESSQTRKMLMNFTNVGPKTSDCFLLNAKGDPTVCPIDVNVLRVCSRLRMPTESLRGPDARLCREFECQEGKCPQYDVTRELLMHSTGPAQVSGCLRAAMSIRFGQDAALLQSMLLLHGVEACHARDPECIRCCLCDLCHGPEVEARSAGSIVRNKHRTIKASHVDDDVEIESLPPTLLHFNESLPNVNGNLETVFSGNVSLRRGNRVDLACAMWISCRMEGIPLSMDETEGFYRIRPHILFRRVQDCLARLQVQLKPLKIESCLSLVTKRLALEGRIDLSGLDLDGTLMKSDGASPFGIAAAIILMISEKNGIRLKQADVARAAGISEVTLRKRRSALEESGYV